MTDKEMGCTQCPYAGHIELKECSDAYTSVSQFRWTDKLSVTSDGDIIDFEGRIVGHMNLEIMKGGVE